MSWASPPEAFLRCDLAPGDRRSRRHVGLVGTPGVTQRRVDLGRGDGLVHIRWAGRSPQVLVVLVSPPSCCRRRMLSQLRRGDRGDPLAVDEAALEAVGESGDTAHRDRLVLRGLPGRKLAPHRRGLARGQFGTRVDVLLLASAVLEVPGGARGRGTSLDPPLHRCVHQRPVALGDVADPRWAGVHVGVLTQQVSRTQILPSTLPHRWLVRGLLCPRCEHRLGLLQPRLDVHAPSG